MKDKQVKSDIEDTFKDHPAYGHRRLAIELTMNHKKILRIMHKYHIKPPRLWYQKKFTTRSDTDYQMKYTNVLKDTAMDKYGINDIWSSDLTYIKYQEKFYYLAIIQDIVSKEIVGFNMSDKHDSDLVLKTLKEAVVYTKTTPKILHSDRGREYLSSNCTDFLEGLNIAVSVSDPGSPWQNAWSESFFSRFKNESGAFSRFATLGELVEYIFGYVSYYNNKRIHSTIKMSPYQFKQKYSESGLEKRGT
jgi:putative transposase